MAVLNSGTTVAVWGLTTPAMVAAGSWRPSRSKRAARIARPVRRSCLDFGSSCLHPSLRLLKGV